VYLCTLNDLLAVCVLKQTTIEMNLSGFIDEDNTTFDINVTEQPQQSEQYEQDAIDKLTDFMTYFCLALGGPGNILSAIVWLSRHVTSKNSSSLYLAVIAINDIFFLLSAIYLYGHPASVIEEHWFFHCILSVWHITVILEPLLVLGLSIERLIAITYPLRVR